MSESISAAQGVILLKGSTIFDSRRHPRGALSLRWNATVLSALERRGLQLASFRVKVTPVAGQHTRGLEIELLESVAHHVSSQIREEYERYLSRSRRHGFRDEADRSWFADLPNIDERLEMLRLEHERSRKLGEIADESSKMSIGEASTLSGLPESVIRDVEKRGLFSPARSIGGQRRYSDSDVRQLRGIARDLETTGGRTETVGIRRQEIRHEGRTDRLHPSDVKDLTMLTVAQLYLEACDRYPKRDRSVIEYIRQHMGWLSADYIVTLIRLARRRGIEMPIYRQGRIPKRLTNSKKDDEGSE